MKWKTALFSKLSMTAISKAVRENKDFLQIWDLSLKIFPRLNNHFVGVQLAPRNEMGLRFLLCSQVLFLRSVINDYEKRGDKTIQNHMDIGDSDGSARILLKAYMEDFNVETLGVNLQVEAIERMRKAGLKAELIDAMDVHKTGRSYDIVSLFETMEHMTDPIGFLKGIQPVVNERLVISVPLIHRSRVSLAYLGKKWPKDKVPTIENTHIFELSPEDWNKVFLHSGWTIEQEKKVRPYPRYGLFKTIMKYLWRRISFEGYWFVSLKKDSSHQNRFCIE